jgi:hypothetical protein
MQIDMHYYGVYALARAAGLNDNGAKRIADASQFVDHYVEEKDFETSDGGLVSYWPSGHGLVCSGTLDPMSLEKADPHKVWVPFHFLPGGGGDDYRHRMRCGKGSNMAEAALGRVLSSDEAFLTPELVGVVAHVYADTFSHYGFSGLRSSGNLVDADTIDVHVDNADIRDYITDKANSFFGALSGLIAGTATRGLGHACVADYPDRPYLRWEFVYEDGTASGLRDNRKTYLDACEGLFGFFSGFAGRCPAYASHNDARDFGDIRPMVEDILAFEGRQEERIGKWEEAASHGSLLFAGEIPTYADCINDEIADVGSRPANKVKSERAYLFTLAVERVRGMVLYDLLPGHGLIG